MYKSFKDMPIWQKAMKISEDIYYFTDSLPRKEDYGFTSQIRRSSLSISANIAEAYGRHHISDKVNFYYMSRGSLTETRSHLEYGKRVGYINAGDYNDLDSLLDELYKDINKLVIHLKEIKK